MGGTKTLLLNRAAQEVSNMNLNEKQKDALLNILEYERTHDPEEFSLGWSWSDVRVPPAP
jgi:hypothetical protein